MARLNFQAMPIGPTEFSTTVVGDRDGIQQLVDALMVSCKDGMARAVIDTGTGNKIHFIANCLNPEPKLGN